jgi:ABC-type polysaccharide/polyol phosphate export permease
MGLYVSPVGFSSSVIPEQWRLLYALNPMVGVIDGFRWAILGGEPLAGSTAGPSSAILNHRLQTLLEKNTPYVKCLPPRPAAPG